MRPSHNLEDNLPLYIFVSSVRELIEAGYSDEECISTLTDLFEKEIIPALMQGELLAAVTDDPELILQARDAALHELKEKYKKKQEIRTRARQEALQDLALHYRDRYSLPDNAKEEILKMIAHSLKKQNNPRQQDDIYAPIANRAIQELKHAVSQNEDLTILIITAIKEEISEAFSCNITEESPLSPEIRNYLPVITRLREEVATEIRQSLEQNETFMNELRDELKNTYFPVCSAHNRTPILIKNRCFCPAK